MCLCLCVYRMGAWVHAKGCASCVRMCSHRPKLVVVLVVVLVCLSRPFPCSCSACDATPTSARSRLWVVSLPEFGYPLLNASDSTITNPANLPPTAVSCVQHNSYWSRSSGSCVTREVAVPFSSDTVVLQRLEVRWRDVPESVKQQFAQIDCAPTDFSCLTAYVERTRQASSALPFQNMFGVRVVAPIQA